MKKLISLILLVTMLLSLTSAFADEIPTPTATPIPNLTEMPAPTAKPAPKMPTDISKHWARSVIEQFVNFGFITPYSNGTYKPDSYVTWGDFIKTFVKALGLPKVNEGDTYKLGSNNQYRPYVQAAIKNKIIDPKYLKTFPYNKGISKYEASLILYNGVKDIWVSAIYSPFEDMPESFDGDKKFHTYITPHADGYDADNVFNLYAKYIISGTRSNNGKIYFYPKSNVTRAQALVMINNVRLYNENPNEFTKQQQLKITTNKNFVRATKDAAFEDYINNNPEAKKYISVQYIRAENGILVFKPCDFYRYSEAIPDNSKYKNINKDVYNTLKVMLPWAKKYNKAIRIFYYRNDGRVTLSVHDQIEWTTVRYNEPENSRIRVEFSVNGFTDPAYDPKATYSISWDFLAPFREEEDTDWRVIPRYNGMIGGESYHELLKTMFKTIYGIRDGFGMYKNILTAASSTTKKNGMVTTSKYLGYQIVQDTLLRLKYLTTQSKV